MSTFLAKYDVKRAMPALYAPQNREFEFVDVPQLTYLSVDGQGDPNGELFQRAIQSIYPVAYGVKFRSKEIYGHDYVVPPLEALWRADDPTAFVSGDRTAWRWTLLSWLPDWICQADVDETMRSLVRRGRAPEFLVTVRAISEGLCLQMLHVGPFANEEHVLADLHDRLMPQQGLGFTGPHHEIYLSDFRKTPEESLRTVLRQPVSRE